MDYSKVSVDTHKLKRGKWEMHSKFPLDTKEELSVAYTPGVAAVCEEIAKDMNKAFELTMKGNSVAIVSDGSAVLGLGNIGPEAALPVMEGKALLFKKFAGIDGVPIVVNSQDINDIVRTVQFIAPTFGGINLEDISAPKCFEVEKQLQNIGIPVFHDDQHGTAIVLLAALLNASKLKGRQLNEMKIVINGAGSAGIAIANLLKCIGYDSSVCQPVKEIIVCDSKGIISGDRTDLNDFKQRLLSYTNPENISGSLKDALVGADCFIGVSKGNLLDRNDIRTMAKDPIIFAMANPTPEIFPDEAKAGGAFVVGTGRSDLPNQINNVLVFPGIFRGALNVRAKNISPKMKLAAAYALANSIDNISTEKVIPDPFDLRVPELIASAVQNQYLKENN